MYLKRFRIIVLIIFIVSLFLGSSVFCVQNNKPLKLVTESVYADDDSMYFIEQSENNCNIYYMDSDGKISGKICVDKISDNYYHELKSLKYINGKVYVLCYINNVIDAADSKAELYECNFEKETFDKIAEFDKFSMADYYIQDDLIYIDYLNADFCVISEIIDAEGTVLKQDILYDYYEADDILSVYKIIRDKYENVYALTMDYKLYKISGYNEYQKIYPVSEDCGNAAEISYDGADKVYFIDDINNKLMYYDIENDICDEFSEEFSEFELSDIRNFSFSESGYYSFSKDNHNNGYYVGRYNNNGFEFYDKITEETSIFKSVLIVMLYSAIAFVGLSLLSFAVYIFIAKYVSFVLKMMILFVTAFTALLLVISGFISGILNSVFENSVKDKLISMCENTVSSFYELSDEEFTEILQTNSFSEIFLNYSLSEMSDVQLAVYNNIAMFTGRGYFENAINISDGSSMDMNDIYYDASNAFYMPDENGNIKLIYNSLWFEGITVPFLKDYSVQKCIEEVMETGKEIVTPDLFFMQECISAYVPVFNSDNEIAGVLEVTLENNKEVSYRVSKITASFVFKILIIMLIIMVVLFFGLFIFLKPLKELKSGANELMHGHMGVQINLHGNNELTKLSQIFNEMSSRLSENINSMQIMSRHYEYYVPRELLKFMGKNDISEVMIGDSKKVQLAVLYINLHISDCDIESHQFVLVLNKFLGMINETAKKYGGIIEYYNRNEIKILYNKKYFNAVRTAVALNELINSSGNRISKYNVFAEFFITYENCEFKAVGNNDRIAIVSSENDILKNEIKKINKNCNIIVTDNIVKQSDDFFRIFDTRFIGICETEKLSFKLYEVFSGDSLYNKNMKRINKETFEKAVKLYIIKEYREARNIFINILENYPEDSLAENYIRLCDMKFKRNENI